MALEPTGLAVDHENSQLILGSNGKCGFEEDYENQRVQNFKRRKYELQAEVKELEEDIDDLKLIEKAMEAEK